MNTTSLSNPPQEDNETTGQPRRAAAAAPVCAPDAHEDGAALLQPRLALLLDGVEAADVRELMRAVFAHASRILGRVRRVRQVLEQEGAAIVVPALLKEVSAESRQLLAVVETAELRVESLVGALGETFDSVAFAMGHELRRVFAGELAPAGGPAGQRVTAALVIRACGLVENCIQQSVITLAQAFDPLITGVTVFEDYKERRENSLVLRNELASLLARVRSGAADASVLTNISVLRHVRRFRYEHLHLLMYRDWEEFEKFADAMEQSYDSIETFSKLLHTFSCYLTTLHGQVSLRAVLTDN